MKMNPQLRTVRSPYEDREELVAVPAVALAAERGQRATRLELRHLRRSWAGLRSFVADGDPVVGFDPAAEGFCWLAGQGGYGVKTSPPLGRVCAAEVLGVDLDDIKVSLESMST